MRWILRIVGLVVLVVLVAVVSLFFLPGERIARIAADQIGARTGREVVITGDTRVRLWPVLGVSTGAVRVANAAWSANGPMFQAERLDIGVDAAALIGGDIRITRLEAVRPEILLERNAEGTGNWELGGRADPVGRAPGEATGGEAGGETAGGETDSETVGGAGTSRAFGLDRAIVTGASVHLIDAAAGVTHSFRDIDLDMAWPDTAGPVDATLVLRPAGEAVTVRAHVAAPAALMAGDLSALTLSAEAPGGSLAFEGRGGLAPAAQGALTVTAADTARLLAALGMPGVAVPQGLGRAADLRGEITLTEARVLSLRKGELTLDGNRASVAADVALDGVPHVTAQLVAGALDLSALGGDGGPDGGAAGAPAGAGWSTAPIDASALGLFDGEIAVTADSIDIGSTVLAPVRAVATIERARGVVEFRELGVFGGRVTGQVVANNRSGLSVGGDLAVANVDLAKALAELAGITRFTGAAEAQVSFLGVGQSVAAIMNSLSGSGRIATGRGTITGFDLDRLMRTGEGTGGTTIFDSLTAGFTMDGGVLRNDDLEVLLASLRATGAGSVGLGAQDVDYTFTPVSLTARDGRGVAIPVRIRGPWGAPRISVDLERAIRMNLEEETKEVERKVRDEVAKELGIEKREGESDRDALRRTLEEEAVRGLGKLFGR